MANSTTHLPPIATYSCYMVVDDTTWEICNIARALSSFRVLISTYPLQRVKWTASAGKKWNYSNKFKPDNPADRALLLCSSPGILHGRQLLATWQHAQLLYEIAQLVANPDYRISRKSVFISRAVYKPWGSFILFTCELLQKRARKKQISIKLYLEFPV
jgi:hypothetical protein